jgi:hypothetical protein
MLPHCRIASNLHSYTLPKSKMTLARGADKFVELREKHLRCFPMAREMVTEPLPGETSIMVPCQEISPRFLTKETGALSSLQTSNKPKASSSDRYMVSALVEFVGRKVPRRMAKDFGWKLPRRNFSRFQNSPSKSIKSTRRGARHKCGG